MSVWDGCNLMHLRYFCSAMRLGSLSASARHWHVGQSAISQSIRRLEEICQGPLLLHNQGRFEPTALGLIFYEHASKVIEAFESMTRAVEASQRGDLQSINIGCSHSVALSLIATALGEGMGIDLKLELSLQIGAPDQIRSWLQQGLLDGIVVVEEAVDDPLSIYSIHEGTFALFQSTHLPPNLTHRLLVSQQPAEFEWLRNQLIEQPQIEWMRVRSWEVLADLAQKSLGIAFLPDYVALGPQRTLEICPLYTLDKLPYRLILATRQQPIPPSILAMGHWLNRFLSKSH